MSEAGRPNAPQSNIAFCSHDYPFVWQNAMFDWGAFGRPASLISPHRSPAGHYAVARRCEKIWWLGPRRCRAGSKPEATRANKFPLRHHTATIEMRVEMRVDSTRGVRVCSLVAVKCALK